MREQAVVNRERAAVEMLSLESMLRPKPGVRAEMDWRARKIKEFIDTDPVQGRRNLDEVCRQLGLSMSGRQARRLFKLSTGVGIRDYVGNRRLSLAVRQLEVTDAPVKAIAAELGFHSPRQFRRRFKEFFGLSPFEFRKASASRGSAMRRSA